MNSVTRRSLDVVGLLLLSLTGALACSGGDSVALPRFHDVVFAPAAIQRAARAVVRVSTAGAIATGSFVSDTGLLLTNNHVLGDSVCPVEGCYVQIMLMHQLGERRQPPESVFAVPVAVDVGLDIAVVQLYTSPGGAKLSTPDYLSFRSETAPSMMGMHVTLVGHPEGHLKKWTDGAVVDCSGSWFWSTAYALPGDSGSPALDDDGKLVGIVHRGATGEDLITRDGVNVYSIGTASASIQNAMNAPLPQVMISTAAATTADAVVANNFVYLNARVPTVMIGSTPTAVLTLLGQACDNALARQDFRSPDDLGAALTPCNQAMAWIECRGDVAPGSYGVCPDAADAAAWTSRYQAMNQLWQDMNGQLDLYPISFGVAHLAGSIAAGRSIGAQDLQQALANAQPALDFGLANYLAAFSVASYAGQDIATYVMGYKGTPHYELEATSIASAAAWLYDGGVLPRAEILAILSQLHDDPHVSVGTKLYLEELEYTFDAYVQELEYAFGAL